MMDANLKRLYAYHVMILPWLMTYIWRKLLGKEADILTTLQFSTIYQGVSYNFKETKNLIERIKK